MIFGVKIRWGVNINEGEGRGRVGGDAKVDHKEL